MARPVTLFTGQWADLPFESICKKAKDVEIARLLKVVKRGNKIAIPKIINIEKR